MRATRKVKRSISMSTKLFDDESKQLHLVHRIRVRIVVIVIDILYVYTYLLS
jgi:hypothetical protein